MAYQLKDGQGSLGKNKNKRGENSPDITGKFLLNGQMYSIAGWQKESESGGVWYSLAVKPQDERDRNGGGGGRREEVPF